MTQPSPAHEHVVDTDRDVIALIQAVINRDGAGQAAILKNACHGCLVHSLVGLVAASLEVAAIAQGVPLTALLADIREQIR